jgi:hypothetical protein
MAASLTIVHFNDVYNIEASQKEPVGGAARFVAKVRRLVNHPPPCEAGRLRQ